MTSGFEFPAKAACKLDADIGQYILSNIDGDFSAVVKNDNRWQVLYHLDIQSIGLLCWYPFRKNSALLQIGGGFGNLTGMLCDKCGFVTVLEHDGYRAECIRRRWNTKSNLRVVNGYVSTFSSPEKYDYIVISVAPGSPEPVFNLNGYASLLLKAKKMLTDHGKLLFAVSNRLGIQYLCGAPDPSTGIPFDGPNAYYISEVALPSLSKAELLDVLKSAEFPTVKFFYPFPDHYLSQMIYTDEYPPGEELIERLRIYLTEQDSLVIDPGMLYRFLADENILKYFTNSFLVECGDGEPCPVLYASVSTERKREESFSTIILDNGTAEKYPLYPEGLQGLERIVKNLSGLKARGIPVISCELDNNRLKMPHIQAPTLSKHLRDLAAHDESGFIRCLDKLYHYILKSSEHVPADKNALAGSAPVSEWGPILAVAYLEMIPVNCFYKNDEFVFFDQEFVKENYPANYVMFRAINDVYRFIPQLEKNMPLSEIKARYGLTDKLWQAFEQEEVRFQDQLRQREAYQHFYRCKPSDIKDKRIKIARNGRLLLMDTKLDYGDRVFASVEGAEGKKIVLFGAGKMMEHYLKKYGTNYPPVFVVDNDMSKWNTEKFGFAIKNPHAICDLDSSQYRVIICCSAYVEIANQLKEMGIKDFRIYLRYIDELLETVEPVPYKSEKYNIGYVTGVFDLFHIGHLNILRRSKERCEYLIAGVLTDELAEHDKGRRPFIPFKERLEIVRQIKYVDRVIPVDFSNTNKLEAWKQLRYDCHFSGSDHEEDWYWLKKQLQTLGSNMEFFPYTESTSSTMLRQLIQNAIV